jgi:hypothetical protein
LVHGAKRKANCEMLNKSPDAVPIGIPSGQVFSFIK